MVADDRVVLVTGASSGIGKAWSSTKSISYFIAPGSSEGKNHLKVNKII